MNKKHFPIPSQNHHLLKSSFQQTKTHLSIFNLNSPLLVKNPNILTYFLKRTTKKLQITKNLKSLTLDLKEIQLYTIYNKILYKYLLKDIRNIENVKIIFSPSINFSNEFFKVFLKALTLDLKYAIFDM